PPWAVSAATHTAGLLLLSLLSFATFGDAGFSLSATVGEDDAWSDVVAEVTLPDATDEASDPAAVVEPLSVDLAAEVALDALVTPVSLETSFTGGDLLSGDAASLMAAVPAAGESAGDADGREAAPSASGGGRVAFFGSDAVANRVAFVVDNSGSMQRGRLETTLMELDAAVWRLTPSQEFHVVFFSDQAYPMFFPASDPGPIEASEANKRALSEWLGTVEMCLGGRLLDAMEIAARAEPDVAYLLTDGDIRSARVRADMTAAGAWGFPIHTLGMGARTNDHIAVLQTIAGNSGGEYRPVDAIPAAVQRARQRPIRYHRTPGEVWGSAVQAW
ncbi:MAG: VWA domain-containing protein, partial [Planctomycetota bacterium]